MATSVSAGAAPNVLQILAIVMVICFGMTSAEAKRLH